jgi:hypothetical protein
MIPSGLLSALILLLTRCLGPPSYIGWEGLEFVLLKRDEEVVWIR